MCNKYSKDILSCCEEVGKSIYEASKYCSSIMIELYNYLCSNIWINQCHFFSDVPDPPSAPKVTNIIGDSVTVGWTPPSNDGGAPVTGYVVEMRQTTSPRWIKATLTPTPDTTFRASRLIRGTEYEFRVCAVNRAGTGRPGEPSNTVMVEDPAGKITPVAN